MAEAISGARRVHDEITAALDDGRRGERLRDGLTVAIAGPPNVGKSTLLNRIARRDVAIVSPIAGTTRDIIELRCDLGGMPVVFLDTAGLRETDDPIEKEGVERARRRLRTADLVLLLSSGDDVSEDHEAIELSSGAVMKVRTKSDLLPVESRDAGEWAISAKTGAGIDDLLAEVERRLNAGYDARVAVITRERHRSALSDAASHLERVSAYRPDALPELVAEDIRLGMRALGRITGRVGVEEILDRLFAGFCIGK
jgi:tRNA modification GTPase